MAVAKRRPATSLRKLDTGCEKPAWGTPVCQAGRQWNRPAGGRRPALRQRTGLVCFGLLLQVIEYYLDYHRVFDAGDHLHRPAAFSTGLNIDVVDALQALRPEPART